MATAAKILDEHRFEARARIADVFALGLVIVLGAALVYDMYSFGYSAAAAASTGGSAVLQRDQAFVRMLAEAFLAAAGMSWIAYRLLSGSARRIGG